MRVCPFPSSAPSLSIEEVSPSATCGDVQCAMVLVPPTISSSCKAKVWHRENIILLRRQAYSESTCDQGPPCTHRRGGVGCQGSIVHDACPTLVVVVVVMTTVDVNVSRGAIQIDTLAFVFQNSWHIPRESDRCSDLVSQQRRQNWTGREHVSLTVAFHLKHGKEYAQKLLVKFSRLFRASGWSAQASASLLAWCFDHISL